jgi:LysM repeat protein
MNNPNPFVPKGSLLEQQSQRRSRLKLVVGCVVAISSLSLVALLIQGCHRENPETQQADNNNPPAMDTNIPSIDTNIPAPPSVPIAPSNTLATAPVPQPPVMPPVVTPPVEPPAAGTEYTIVAGDTLAKIAKKNGVSVKAIEAANPGVDPKKLKPGKKLTIPAGGTSSGGMTPPAAAPGGATDTGGQTYVVKSGDTLTKIAKSHGVTLKALRAANPKIASTSHINVGDKLVIPAKAEATATAPTPDTSTVPTVPPPSTAPAPITPPAQSPTPGTAH